MPFSEHKAAEAARFMENLVLSEGEWEGQRMRLVPWQRQVIREVFGRLNDDGTRQYRTVWIEVPKKNGKSGFTSGLGLKMFLADGEPSPEVYCAAVTRGQANVIFEASEYMVRASKRLDSMCKIARSIKTIRRRNARGTFQALSADVPSKHGLKPSAVLIDELHAFPSRRLYDVLTKGSGASRRQPLTVIITTAGERKEGVAWELHQRAVAKLKAMAERKSGEPEPDPTFYAVVYAADEKDDPGDVRTLLKANPSAAQFPSLMANLKAEWVDAKGKAIDEALFKQLRLNIWGTPTVAKWLHISVWDRAKDIVVNPEQLKGRPAIGGLDLSSVSDMTAWAILFESEEDPEALDVLIRLWVPEEKLHDRHNPNRDLYQVWFDQGLLQVTPGDAIDFDTIEQQVLADAETYGVTEFAVDYLFQARQICQNLADQGMKPVPFRQGFISYGPVMSEFERRLLLAKIHHGAHPILHWMFENLEVERDSTGNLKPSKRNKALKIDGLVAIIMALDRVMRHQGHTGIEKHGIRVL